MKGSYKLLIAIAIAALFFGAQYIYTNWNDMNEDLRQVLIGIGSIVGGILLFLYFIFHIGILYNNRKKLFTKDCEWMAYGPLTLIVIPFWLADKYLSD